ncbi:hypothetical protein M595_4623 [Lyngbya aestuarii BL J]|uniref:Uncharacterized protein n=1 Tax=Lyngbya aestuarii BL J TaxID=1348334 RepID=U7QEE9_9CYAN|nr:hypothetical protein M595_4623 [Lyngbya aestuarii BL J]
MKAQLTVSSLDEARNELVGTDQVKGSFEVYRFKQSYSSSR